MIEAKHKVTEIGTYNRYISTCLFQEDCVGPAHRTAVVAKTFAACPKCFERCHATKFMYQMYKDYLKYEVSNERS